LTPSRKSFKKRTGKIISRIPKKRLINQTNPKDWKRKTPQLLTVWNLMIYFLTMFLPQLIAAKLTPRLQG